MQIVYKSQARKALKRTPRQQATRILDQIEKLAENPGRDDLDTKKLQGRDGYRLRVGDYRVIYTAAGVILTIEKIAPRGDVYK